MSQEYDLGDELIRKAGESMLWLESEHKRGAISAQAYLTGLVAVDLVTLGLIPDEYSAWLSEQRLVTDKPSVEQVTLQLGHSVIVIKLNRKEGVVTVKRVAMSSVQSREYTFENETDQTKAAASRFERVVAKLKSEGYVEL